MDEARLQRVRQGLDRLRDDSQALRARELLDVAIDHGVRQPVRWTEQMCYAIREVLESIPPLFGQPRQQEPLGPVVRRFYEDLQTAIDLGRLAERLDSLLSDFEQRLRLAEMTRRQRVAQAMIAQAGGGMSTPQLDAFAAEWAEVVEGVNNILHGGSHTEDDANRWLDRAIELLEVLVAPMSVRLDDVDNLADLTSPTPAEVQRLLDFLADSRLARHFFLRVNSPQWLEILEGKGIFNLPVSGDWLQGEFLVRVSAQAPDLARTISGRLATDPHPAAGVATLGVTREVGPIATDLAARALTQPQYQNPFVMAFGLEELIETWGQRGTTETLSRLADVALEPQGTGSSFRLTSKFGDHEFARLVHSFVDKCHCDHLTALARIMVFKLRRAIGLSGGGISLSSFREDVSSDEATDRDIGNALISGVRDSLQKMKECGESLARRQEVLGSVDNQVLVRIWAHHLATEVEGGD